MPVHVHDFPGTQYHYELQMAEFSQKSVVETAVGGLFRFCGDFISPLAIDVGFGCFDVEYMFPVSNIFLKDAYWLLSLETLPSEVVPKSVWKDARAVNIPRNDETFLCEWILDAQKKVEKTNHQALVDNSSKAGISEIRMHTAKVQLPASMKRMTSDSISLQYGSRTVEYPTERSSEGRYVNVPVIGKIVPAPVEITVSSSIGGLSIDISILWSLWSDKNQEGYRAVAEAFDRLRDVGWRDV